MALAMEEDVASDPVNVRLFRPRTHVPRPNRVANLIEQLGPPGATQAPVSTCGRTTGA
jgi:hypothetical protein